MEASKMKIFTYNFAHFYRSEEVFEAPVKSEKTNSDTRKSLSVKSVLALIGLIGGFLLMAAGVTLWAVFSFTGTLLYGLDVVLLILAFIFLGVGAHFLDKADEENKAERIERCRQQGIID
jgi:uncharacterized membrane protein